MTNANKNPSVELQGRFNAPKTREVSILIVCLEFEKRDITIETKDWYESVFISESPMTLYNIL